MPLVEAVVVWEVFRAGCVLNRNVCPTKIVDYADTVATNSNPDESQLARASWAMPVFLKEKGDVVIISHSQERNNVHHWSGLFGTDFN